MRISNASTNPRKYRLNLITETLRRLNPDFHSSQQPVKFIESLLRERPTALNLWMILYIHHGVLPTAQDLQDARFEVLRDGAKVWLRNQFKAAPGNPGLRFELVFQQTIVDVFHTAKTDLATGIQRVAKETATRWSADHDVSLIAWNDNWEYFRRLTPKEAEKFHSPVQSGLEPESFTHHENVALVPIDCRYVLVELNADPIRVARTSGFLDATGSELLAITFDCVPITSSETTARGMPYAFANYLDLISRASRIAPISKSAENDFLGWRAALQMTGRMGPDVKAISLAAEVSSPTVEQIRSFSDEFEIDQAVPLISCVGSHEPRKNHLALLRAAERLWDSGNKFQLVLMGGNSWGSEYFELRVKELRAAGHALRTFSKVSDAQMNAAVSSSLFTVFPSLNEGFGLPVAESLLLKTPVITSDFGSTREIAFNNGGLLIDPRDDDALVAAMQSLLSDSEVLQNLKTQTENFPSKTWATYADQVWQYFS